MKVFMRSEEYGYEEFEAEDMNEALKIVRRLRRSAKEQNDGIVREIGIKAEGGNIDKNT
jgi:hypothetical protein